MSDDYYIVPKDEHDHLIALMKRYKQLAQPAHMAGPAQPREWRTWDIVNQRGHAFWLRMPFADPCWLQVFRDCINKRYDSAVGKQNGDVFVVNLADLLAEGDVLVALTEEEAKHIATWHDIPGYHEIANKCKAALARREAQE